MKHHKFTPVELARDTKDSGSPELFDPAVVGRVQELTEERRWDALRGITHLANRYGWPAGDVREVVLALGLAEGQKRTEESEPVEREVLLAAVDHPERVVACPDCHAPPGAVCETLTTTSKRRQPYNRGHVARHRQAEQ